MKRAMLIAPALTAWLITGSPGDAQELRYLGKEVEASTGWIEIGPDHYHEIGPGAEIPAWGTVDEVREDRLIVRSRRTPEDKQRAHEEGSLVYDVLEIHVLREDLRHPRWEGPPTPRR